MLYLNVQGSWCYVCSSEHCAGNYSVHHHNKNHSGGKAYRYRVRPWQVWRPTLEDAMLKSYRAARRAEGERSLIENKRAQAVAKLKLAQETLVRAMLDAQGR